MTPDPQRISPRAQPISEEDLARILAALEREGKSLISVSLKYSEDQPRDESGQWTDGGGGGSSGGGATTSGGSISVVSDSSQIASARSAASDVSLEMGVHGAAINVVDKTPTPFKVGDKAFEEAGHFDPVTREIEINARYLSDKFGAKIVASHELTHHIYNELERARDRESNEIDALSAAEYEQLYDSAGYARTEALPELRSRFPVSAFFARRLWDSKVSSRSELESQNFVRDRTNALAKDDGVTNYSKAYWDADWRNIGMGFSNAVNETLAELTAIRFGKAALGERARSKLWNDFYNDMMTTYRQHIAVKK